MFEISPLSDTPPASLEEALLQANNLFERLGIPGAHTVIKQPPSPNESLRGGILEAVIPICEIEAAAGHAAVSLAAKQGLKVTLTKLSLRNSESQEHSLECEVELETRLLGASLTIRVRGIAAAPDGEALCFRALRMDAGAGAFASMAAAFLRPKLDALEASNFELTRIAGVPVRLRQLEFTAQEPTALLLAVQFT
jgi:hypothetical protein